MNMTKKNKTGFTRAVVAWLKTTAIPLIVMAGILSMGYLGPHWLLDSEPETAAEQGVDQKRTLVELPADKNAAGNISTKTVELRNLTDAQTVASTVRYDETRVLMLRAPLSGVVQQVFVKAADTVSSGTRLVSLTAEEMGMARNERERCMAALRLAESRAAWSREVYEGVTGFAANLRESPSAADSQATSPKKMGQYGERLTKALSAWKLATVDLTNVSKAKEAVSGRNLREREAAAEQALAALRGEIEQISFDAEQQLQKDDAGVEEARNQLAISNDKVAALLGPAGENDASANSSQFFLNAPFEGRIEDLHLVPAERIDRGEIMLVLADSTNLWVTAEVSESAILKLNAQVGEVVQIRTTDEQAPPTTGKIRFVGSTVNSGTRTIPIVIDLPNPNGLLRPGMLVWTQIPFRETTTGMAIPASSIARHENETFVFVEEAPLRFRKTAVTVVREIGEWVHVVSPELKPGFRVVDQGVFYLKSELLLEANE